MLCLVIAIHIQFVWNYENMCYLSQHFPVFQDWKHILVLTFGYTGANKNTECLL